ncbi:MAG: PilZ domain-containing protein [Rhodobacteraceae bacterium]|nr:PilZ domain-containing protein [Paracoccaceae bacterium]
MKYLRPFILWAKPWKFIAPLVFAISQLTGSVAFAQSKTCDFLQQLRHIEIALSRLSIEINRGYIYPDKITRLKNDIDLLEFEVEIDRTLPMLLNQLSRSTNWVADYFITRKNFMALSQTANPFLAPRLAATQEFTQFGRNIDTFADAFQCVDLEQSGTETSGNQRPEQPSTQLPSRLGKISRLGEDLGKFGKLIESFLKDNVDTIAPLGILVALGISVWMLLRIDDARRDLRKRYSCHIAVQVSQRIGNKTVVQHGYIADISRSGVRLILDKKPKINVILTINTANFTRRARIMWMQNNEAGCNFRWRLKAIPKEFELTTAPS